MKYEGKARKCNHCSQPLGEHSEHCTRPGGPLMIVGRNCSTCHNPIPKDRLLATPQTFHCVNCSTVKMKTAKDVDVSTGDMEGILGSHQALDKR